MQCRIPMQYHVPCLARATFSVLSARSKLCFFFTFVLHESTWKGAKSHMPQMRDVQQRAIQWQVSAVYLPSGKDEQYTQCIVQRLQGHDLIQLLMGQIQLTLRLFVVQFTRGTNRYYQFLWRTSFILIFDILIWTYGTWLTTIDFKFCCGFFLVCPEVSSLVGAALSGAQPGGEAAPCPCSSTSWGT